MHIDNPAYEENVITDVYRKGYTLGDKVIRFSMVVVANWIGKNAQSAAPVGYFVFLLRRQLQ